MGNYYTETSFIVSLPEEAIDWLVRVLNEFDEFADDIENGVDFNDPDVHENDRPSKDLEELLEHLVYNHSSWLGFQMSRQERNGKPAADFMSDESANIDLLAELLHETLKKFDLDTVIEFGWAATASRPYYDAFGGGYVVTSKRGLWYFPGMSVHRRVYREEHGLLSYIGYRMRGLIARHTRLYFAWRWLDGLFKRATRRQEPDSEIPF